MNVYVVTRTVRDTWSRFSNPYTSIVKVFLEKEDAEEWIAKESIGTVQYRATFSIEQVELGTDYAVGYDMLALTAYCGVCGNPVDPTENYCSQCGVKLKWDMEKWNELIAEMDRRRKRI